jgi:hypothetical protein
VVDDEGRRLATVRVIDVVVSRFADVPDRFALAEGEGELDAEDFGASHTKYWSSEGTRSLATRSSCSCTWGCWRESGLRDLQVCVTSIRGEHGTAPTASLGDPRVSEKNAEYPEQLRHRTPAQWRVAGPAADVVLALASAPTGRSGARAPLLLNSAPGPSAAPELPLGARLAQTNRRPNLVLGC